MNLDDPSSTIINQRLPPTSTMEPSRLLIHPTHQAVSILCRSQCRPRARPFVPQILRQQCGLLSTSGPPRYAQSPITHSWFVPQGEGKTKNVVPPQPPRRPKSPPDTGARPSKMVAWSTLGGGTTLGGGGPKIPPSKQRQNARKNAKLEDDVDLTIRDINSSGGSLQAEEKIEERIRPFFRRKPETGKLIQIRPGKIDLAGALARLQARVFQNRIPYHLAREREYERPGLRRKRQRSERWKKCFSEAFKNTVKRANQLSKMGW